MRSSRAAFLAFLARVRHDPTSRLAPDAPPGLPGGQPTHGTRATLRFYLSRLKGQRLALAAALLVGSVGTLFSMVLPALPKLAIDFALVDPQQPRHFGAYLPPIDAPLARLLVFAAIAVIGQLISTVLTTWARGRVEKVGTLVELRVRREVFAKTLRLPLHRIAATKTGGLVSIIRDEVAVFGELTRTMFLGPFTSMVQAVATVVIVASLDIYLLAGPVLMVPVLWVTHKNWTRRLRPFWVGARDARIANDALATEALRGVRVVRSYRAEPTEVRRFAVGSHLVARQRMHAWWRGRLVGASWELMGATGSAVFFAYGGWRVVTGVLTVGDLLWFLASLAALLRPATTLVALANDLMRDLVRVDRAMTLLDEPDDITTTHGADPSALEPAIVLDHVTFRYPQTDEAALDDVCLEIPAGHTVALVGASGGGKSTIAQLIARLADPDSGAVCFGGVDARTLELSAYRRQIALVDQETFVFDATVEENIRYGRRGATREAVRVAGERAGVRDFVDRTAEGWQRHVGESGWALSGGQRQRISIARAFLSEARVVIFDEATSQLDAETEADIQRALEALHKQKTCVVIAHRLSTVRQADLIYVIEAGKVVESGTHEALLARAGRYATLVAEQLTDVRARAPRRSANATGAT